MPLSAFNNYRQFILRRGKIPTSPHTGETCDPHDPNEWVTFDEAVHKAGAIGCDLGFVFTESDPFFFLDIDHCREGDGWSQLAQSLIATLPGAAIEVSGSGEGLHVFGTYSSIEEHGCKNTDLGIELYTKGRYVALTYDRTLGNAATDCTTSLHELIAQYFPPSATCELTEWTTTSQGTPLSDIEVIAKAAACMSGRAAFGTAPTFNDLYTANEEALGKFYPSLNPHDPYDRSSADAALAQKLTFWCGNNCEQVERIMRMSELVRDKWNDRKDYVKRTVLNAVSRQEKVYVSRSQTNEVVQQVVGAGVMDGAAAILAPTQQQEYFKGCVYVSDLHKVFVPDGRLLKPEQFRATYGGYDFVIDNEGKSTKNAWEAFTESRVVRFPQVVGTCFRPDLEPGAIVEDEGFQMVNVYVPIETPARDGDPEPFLRHLRAMLPDERDAEIFLSYMAAIKQYPGVKFQWSPLLQGCEGNGKTLFIRCIEFAVGKRYTHLPNSADLGANGSKFNQWIQNKMFIGLEEIYVGDRREIADALKPLITNTRIEIQGKGTNQVTGDNRANFIMCSNHKDAVRKTANDRRYCVLYTAQQSQSDMQQCGFAGEYFPRLYDWLRNGGYEIVNGYLSKYRIRDEFNPATSCHRAPVTSSTDEAIVMSRGRVEQEIFEAIEEGRAGFAGGWVSSIALDELLDTIRASNTIPRNKRRQMMEDIGYILHPALRGGRVNNIVQPDDGKPRLYVQVGHMSLNLTSSGEIAKAYTRAQPAITNSHAAKVFGG